MSGLFTDVTFHEKQEITDQFNRVFSKLRLSVTDRCAFRCFYCRREEKLLPRENILTFEEMTTLARLLTHAGIKEIRLTGGEPLRRKHLEDLVLQLKNIHDIHRVSLTTNGESLCEKARVLKQAGLDDVNISLDTLKPERFREICGADALQDVLRGIYAAKDAGLSPKANCVVIRGMNDDEIIPLLMWSNHHGIPLRFIEWMPTEGIPWDKARVVTEKEILEKAGTLGAVQPLVAGNGPATLYGISEINLTFGIIPTISNPFCHFCNRMRISADGILYPCLFAHDGLDLKSLLRKPGMTENEILFRVRQALFHKEEGFIADAAKRIKIPMSRMGG